MFGQTRIKETRSGLGYSFYGLQCERTIRSGDLYPEVARRPIQFYYLATPLFVLVDMVFSYSFRAPFLSSEPAIRYVYYGFVLGLGVFLLWRPRFTEFVALTESSLSLLILIADLYLAITAFDRWLPPHASAADASALYMEKLVGFLINGSVLAAAVLGRTDAIDGECKHSQRGMI